MAGERVSTYMNTLSYGKTKIVITSFELSKERIQTALEKEGFGVLTTIDVKETFKKKLNKEFDNYYIFGVCHPESAYTALTSDKQLGLLLPCNVIVYEEKNVVHVSIIRPTIALAAASHPQLEGIAKEIEEKLERVIDQL